MCTSISCSYKKSDMQANLNEICIYPYLVLIIIRYAQIYNWFRQVPKTQTVTSSILDSEKGAVLVGL